MERSVSMATYQKYFGTESSFLSVEVVSGIITTALKYFAKDWDTLPVWLTESKVKVHHP